MITKAIIKKQLENNKYQVYIPIFATAGLTSSTTFSADILEATVCYQPGNTNGLRVDDVVFIDFEDTNYDKPVIIGKLYLGEEQEATSYQLINNLNVNGTTNLLGEIVINDLDLTKFIKEVRLKLQSMSEGGVELNWIDF